MGADVYNATTIPQGNWSSTVLFTAADGGDPAGVTVIGLDTGTATLSGTVANAGDFVVLTVTAAGGGTFQEQLQAICDISGGSVFQDAGGNYFVFSSGPLTDGRSYAAVAGFGAFSGGSPTACFVENTGIETDRGLVPVQALRPGDRVRLHRQTGFAPVVWVGQRSIVCARHRGGEVWPVRIAAGAVAPGRPARDVYLSPEHSLYIDGVLVPVRHLLNDATIVQVPTERVTYWHVELATHDVLLADGLPAESFLDTGNRAGFAAPGGAASSPGLARTTPARPGPAHTAPARTARAAWAQACAPLLEDPRRQSALRRRLRDRATSLGFRETQDAALCLRAEGRPIAAAWDGTALDAMLPGGLRVLHLHSRTAVAGQQIEGSDDFRRLGVAVLQVTLDDTDLRLEDGRLMAGWHPPEHNLRWTDGSASLVLPPTRRPIRLRVRTAPMLRYWCIQAEQLARAA
jgi:hypothetical protein